MYVYFSPSGLLPVLIFIIPSIQDGACTFATFSARATAVGTIDFACFQTQGLKAANQALDFPVPEVL